MKDNPYFSQIEQTLPRLLALFDKDSTGASYGMGDRFHWAWGLIDFANGTMQGAAHGFSTLWTNNLWPYPTSKTQFLQLINSIFQATKKITRKNGSLEEAFPNESSFCVTSLVAFDLLCTFKHLKDSLLDETAKEWLSIIEPLISFTLRNDEKHGLISNHLATAAAALLRWHDITKSEIAEKRAIQLLSKIFDNQSSEGWFKEYQGADPGYQSLCTYYLADIYINRPDLMDINKLKKSIVFLSYFAHPDGSFGGIYGCRNTRFFYPSGLVELAKFISEANSLSAYMSKSITEHRTIPLICIDDPNIIPMFNSYCRAAVASINKAENDKNINPLPFSFLENHVHFPEAGIIVDGGKSHYTLISTHKGGVTMHFKKEKLANYDAGVVVKNKLGRLGSSQGYSSRNSVSIKNRRVEIKSKITKMNKRLPRPVEFILLRILALTVFRFSFLRENIKRFLVRILITGEKSWSMTNTRNIFLGENLTITDTLSLPKGYERINIEGTFVPIHMASRGYWQIQDEESL